MLSHLSRVQFFATLWAVAQQAPLSIGFSWQEWWSGLPFPPPGELPNPRIEPVSFKSPALAGRQFTTNATWEAHKNLRAFFFLICYYFPGYHFLKFLLDCLVDLQSVSFRCTVKQLSYTYTYIHFFKDSFLI